MWEEAREAAAERLMVGRGAPRVAKPKPDALEWGEGESGRGTAGEERSGFAYLHIQWVRVLYVRFEETKIIQYNTIDGMSATCTFFNNHIHTCKETLKINGPSKLCIYMYMYTPYTMCVHAHSVL